jgi:hypothetical protein
MNKKIDSEKNGGVSRGEAAASYFEKEVYKTCRDNIAFPFEKPVVQDSRYNPYKESMNK